MATDIVIPSDLWQDDSEAAITAWLISDGAHVARGQLVAEIMVEKTQFEISAPVDGAVRLLKQVDDVASKGEAIARIE